MILCGKSDIGRRRNSNQDEFAVGRWDDDKAWAVVCDGMGGANGGHVASTLAVQTIGRELERGRDTLDGGPESMRALLEYAVAQANEAIYMQSVEDEKLTGMGTTVVAVIVIGAQAGIIHVGDSRAYRCSKEEIAQLTTDHSYVQEMVQAGKLTEEQARNHPKRNMITRALGIAPDVETDFAELMLRAGDVLILCTDGLSNLVDADEIKEIVQRDPKGACEALVDEANQRGGYDNITAVVLS